MLDKSLLYLFLDSELVDIFLSLASIHACHDNHRYMIQGCCNKCVHNHVTKDIDIHYYLKIVTSQNLCKYVYMQWNTVYTVIYCKINLIKTVKVYIRGRPFDSLRGAMVSCEK